MNDDNINNYLPSLLNPRAVKKENILSLTQKSIVSRKSLSLKRPYGLTTAKVLNETKNSKENTPYVHNSERVNKELTGNKIADNDSFGCSVIEDLTKSNKENSRCANNLIYESQNVLVKKAVVDVLSKASNKKNCIGTRNLSQAPQNGTKDVTKTVADDNSSLGFSFNDIWKEDRNDNTYRSNYVFEELNLAHQDVFTDRNKYNNDETDSSNKVKLKDGVPAFTKSSLSISSANRLDSRETKSESTVIYDLDPDRCFQYIKPTIQVSFGINDCEAVVVNSTNGTIKTFTISHNEKNTNIDCKLIENSQISTETDVDENMNETSSCPRRRPNVAVNLEIKKQKLSQDSVENSKILILKTNAIEKISHVIVQPPNYKFVKRNLTHQSRYKKNKSCVRNGKSTAVRLSQVAIESFFRPAPDANINVCKQLGTVTNDVSREMSKNSGIVDAAKCERLRSAKLRRDSDVPKSPRREINESPKSARLPSKRDITSPRRQDVKTSNSDAPSPRNRNESMSAHNPRKNVDSIHFNLPIKSKSNKTSLSPRNIPHHKIVPGTHFAVDAFSYGEIPNVKHYFLTHFHSDHYSGLKKSFSKLLFCSKITADLCISRLGVNPKNIRVINIDEVLRIEGVEVTAVDANHCPGALMLVFTLANGKTLLHTGDFRACPAMESYPVFWNKDIHTVYLDTTYCNPRYDFPTQDQSLEMALYILRQKKMALEKAGKKFSSVLIVCGTYTIGKEKFFLGMSRRVGCGVWACPEKERVLQTVEGRACSRDPPDACQLHVVPMRDLTHEKLRSYLDSLQGAFTEVVAFKPSGWENGKNSSVEKDSVTIHGIPYSEHSSFSELIRFVKFLKPKQVVPTVDISGGVKSVQKYFPCPLVYKDEFHCQTKVTDYFSIHSRQQVPAVT